MSKVYSNRRLRDYVDIIFSGKHILLNIASIRYNRYTKAISRNPWPGLAGHTLRSTALKHSDSFTYVPPTSI